MTQTQSVDNDSRIARIEMREMKQAFSRRDDKRKISDFPVISLFSGAMGLDLGFEDAGLDIRVSQDFDPFCVRTMSANGKNYVPGDIRKLIANDPDCDFILKPANLDRSEVFAIIGGPPCQPFSTAGKRLSTMDPRGSLFVEFCKAVDSIRPRFFVMENVKGLLSSAIRNRSSSAGKTEPFTEEEMPGSAFRVIRKSFQKLGYRIVFGILDAVHYGVPQFRERLVVIGSRDNESIFLPLPTHFQIHQNPSNRWQTLRQAISDLVEKPGLCVSFSHDRIKLLQMVPPGGNWNDLPKEIVKSAMGGAYESDGGKVGFYRRLDYNQPSPTLVTSPVQKATMLCHPEKDRPLSVHEYMRLQQFPDDWIIEGSATDCYRQIGNAVPVGLARALGQVLVALAKGNAEIKTKRTRGTSVHRIMDTIQNRQHKSELF
jgi:DNA (cytosine-5)-methyltransferase 1